MKKGRHRRFEEAETQRLDGNLQLRVALLGTRYGEQGLEQRSPLIGEYDVGRDERVEAVNRIGARFRLFQIGNERLHTPDRHRHQQRLAVGEMTVGRARRNADAAAGFGEGEPANALLRHQVDRGVDQGVAEIAMMIAAWLLRSRPGSCDCGGHRHLSWSSGRIACRPPSRYFIGSILAVARSHSRSGISRRAFAIARVVRLR